MGESVAVEIRDGVKSYVKGTIVLNHMDMTVPRGTIYGLLGSSGCGKTSVLSCIVGLRQLDSGKILVFGKEPGTKGSGIPGRRLGYMPQDIALYPNFTIREILLYFGRIYGMPKSDILKRAEFLTNFLQLPDSSKRISSLSGGQKRRTSLATAFVHDPELLILDEPTVGLDPVLRNSIWDHLCEMVKNGRRTVIVTTHYTEEARRSDTIGLMRNGRLLAENSPDNLLKMFNIPLLEDIVLELCRKDHERLKRGQGAVERNVESDDNENSLVSPYPRSIPRVTMGSRYSLPFLNPKSLTGDSVAESQNCDCVVIGFDHKNPLAADFVDTPTSQHPQVISQPCQNLEVEATFSSQIKRLNSLIRRNCIYFSRNILFILMLLVFPAIQTTLVATTIGGDPKNLSLAVVNEELPEWKDACNSSVNVCKTGKFSCLFLDRLNNLNLIPFSSKEKALEEANSGKLYGLITIPTNYSQHVLDRDVFGNYPDNETLDGSTIGLNLDYSNYIASLLITKQLYESLEKYGMQLGEDCGKSSKEFKFPLEYRQPVYGRLEAKYTEYVVPGALAMILFLLPLASCGLAFVADKCQGTMDRSMVAGVTAFDMMFSFFVTDGLMIIFQALISTLIIVFGFDFKVEGSYILYGTLCLLTGLCGQSYGFALGLICPDEASLLLTGFTLHFPMLVMGGIIWPLEGIPYYIRYFSHCLPVTASLNAMRSIVARGVGLDNVRVWPGFLILCAWIVAAWTLAIMKYKNMRK